MPYDALGNFVPGDELPSTDQMRYELSRKSDAQPPAQQPVQSNRPLDQAIQSISAVATQANPLMLMKSMQDAGRIAVNMASPPLSAWAGVLGNAQAKGAEYLHRLVGDEASAKEAANRVAPVDLGRFAQPMQTPMGQAFEESLGKAFNALHLPPMGPGSGMPGHAPVSPRPMLTPNDVRVMGAEATRVGRQVRDIPTDFSNAQSGFVRLDPVTNQPTVGARLQGAAENVGRIVEERQMSGKSPVPGVPNVFMPETSMYAVRPEKTMLARPNVPETAKGYSVPFDPVRETIANVVPFAETGMTDERLHNKLVDKIDETNNGRREHQKFLQDKIQEMYPGESKYDAQQAFNAMFYDKDARYTKFREWTDEFIASPQGKALLGDTVPSSQELKDRHDAAISTLNGAWGNYITRNFGTENAPLVKAAGEGLTMLPATKVLQLADELPDRAVTQNRIAGGMPAGGTFERPIAETEQALTELRDRIADINTRRTELYDAWRVTNPDQDPARNPDYAALTEPLRKAEKEREKLTKKLDNLRLGAAYEKIEDYSVVPRKAKATLEDLRPVERQFYPSIQKTPPEEKVYLSESRSVGDAGFYAAMKKFYDDVMSGELDKSKLNNFSVEKYVRKYAGERVAQEEAAAKAFAEYPKTVQKNLTERLASIPDNMSFGNAKVIELNGATPVEQAIADVSADTAVLDHCIGSGGGGDRAPHPFTKNPRSHWPIIDPATGVKHVNASMNETAFVRNLRNGDELALFRDSNTGLPVFSLELSRSHIGQDGLPKFNLHWASGANNGPVEPQFKDAIRDYLNARPDSINSTGGNLESNAGIYDMRAGDSARMARRAANVTDDQLRIVDWESLPRFMTIDDVKAAVKGNTPSAALATIPERAATPAPAQRQVMSPELHNETMRSINDALDSTISSAIDNANIYDLDELENRLRQLGLASLESLGEPGQFVQDPLGRMNRVIEYAENASLRERSRGSQLGDAIADGLDDFLVDLRGIQHHIERQMRAANEAIDEEPRNAIVSQRGNRFDTTAASQTFRIPPDLADEIAIRLSDDTVSEANLRGMLEYARTGSPRTIFANLTDAERQGAIRMIETALDEFSVFRRADTQALGFVPSELQQQPQRQVAVTRELLGDFIQQQRRELGAPIGDRVETVVHTVAERHSPYTEPAAFADALRERAGREDSELVERALRELAEQIEFPTQGWEPDPTHPANQPTRDMRPATQQIAEYLLNIEREPDGTLRQSGIDSTIQALQTGQLDHPSFNHIPPGPERAAAMEPVTRDFLNAVAIERQQQAVANNNRPAIAPTELSDNDLSLRVSADMPNGEGWRRLNEFVDQVALVARENNSSIEGVQRAIRNGDVAMEGFSPFEREYAAREVATLMRLYNNRPTTAPVPAQPAVAPFEPIARDLQQLSLRDLTEPMPVEERNAVLSVSDRFVDANTPEEITNIIGLVRSHVMSAWENFSDSQRELLARQLEEHVDIYAQEQVGNIMANVSMAMHEYADTYSLPYALDTLDHVINNVRRGNFTELLDEADYTSLLPGARDALLNELTELRNELENDHGGAGHANGGPVRGYANGGIVHQIPSVDEMRYALMMRSK